MVALRIRPHGTHIQRKKHTTQTAIPSLGKETHLITHLHIFTRTSTIYWEKQV